MPDVYFSHLRSFTDAEQKEWLASHKPKRAKGI
jgi:hypothetical protein